MNTSLTKTIVAGFLSVLTIAGVGEAVAADNNLMTQVQAALAKKDIVSVRQMLATGPGNVDAILKALLKKAQATMDSDPEFTSQMVMVAGEHAKLITPPSVPEVCADVRRLTSALQPEEVGSDLFKSIVGAANAFAKAPVVVAAGHPNDCDQAVLDQEALLAQTPGLRAPGLPPTTVRPGDKTSED